MAEFGWYMYIIYTEYMYALRTNWGESPTLEKPEGVARHFLARQHFEGAFPADPDIFNSRLQEYITLEEQYY